MSGALVVLVAALALVQDGRREHVRALRAERTASFLSAWEHADAEARARACAALVAGRPSGAPAGAAPTLKALDAARHALRGPGADEVETRLRNLVDALDVRVVPGAFGPAQEGRGQPLTVRVNTLWNVEAPAAVTVTLRWLAPEGTTSEARSEEIGGGAFSARGFEMYVRAPLSASGRLFGLELEARSGKRSARAVPVPVACVASPAEPESAAARELQERWQALCAEGWRSALAPGVAQPAGLAYATARTSEWAWFLRDDPTPRCALVLLAPPEEAAEAVLLDPLAARWRATGDELGARVIAARLPYPLGSGEHPDLAHFLTELPGLADLQPDARVFLVARGMASTHLLPGLSGELPPALAGVAFGAAVRADLPDTPVPLLPAPDQEADAAPPASLRPLAELDLPRRVRSWIATLQAPPRSAEPTRAEANDESSDEPRQLDDARAGDARADGCARRGLRGAGRR